MSSRTGNGRIEIGLLAALVGAAILLRGVTATVYQLHPDEIHYAYDIVQPSETATLTAVRDVHCEMLVERRTAHPMLAALLTRWLWFAPLSGMFEWSPGFLRGFNVIAGGLLPLLGWGIVRLYSRSRALLAALLITVHPALIQYSATLYLDPVYSASLGVMLLGFALAYKRENWIYMALAGAGYAMAASTKIGAPIYGPVFLVGLGMVFWRLPRSDAWKGFFAGGVTALALFLIFTDLGAYLLAIFSPTDPRYSDEIENHGWSGALELIMISVQDYFQSAFWQGPISIFFLSAVCLSAGLRKGEPLTILLVIALVCSTPLMFLHHPRLSGFHGFYPIWLFLLLALVQLPASGAAKFLLILQFSFSLVAVGFEAIGWRPIFTPQKLNQHNELFELSRGDIFCREHPVIFLDQRIAGAWTATVRHAQLAEGAIILLPGVDTKPTSQVLRLSDVAILPKKMAAFDPEDDPSFVRSGESQNYVSYRRVSGERMAEIPGEELAQLPTRVGWMLPGYVYPISGHLMYNGARAADSQQLRYDGFQNYLEFGTGVIESDIPPGGVFTIAPPEREDIFWRF